jgi:hypothetical protein
MRRKQKQKLVLSASWAGVNHDMARLKNIQSKRLALEIFLQHVHLILCVMQSRIVPNVTVSAFGSSVSDPPTTPTSR